MSINTKKTVQTLQYINHVCVRSFSIWKCIKYIKKSESKIQKPII